MSRSVATVALCVLLPLTLAAADPRNDTAPCLETHGPGDPPDLVRAVGWMGEEGTTALWRLTFSRPLQVPDPADPPFRVDVLVRDPRVPVISFGNYRRVNRIVRFDASGRDAPEVLLFVPEGGHTPFNPPVLDGSTLTLEMPGRLLLGTDRFGRVDLARLRWSVLVRDGGRCDLLGDGVPTLRLASTPPASPSEAPRPAPSSTATATGNRSGVGGIVAAVVVAMLAIASVFFVAITRRR